ncbi:site-2 protease family protein [Jannaschia donghaensis]|uniref:Zinc metalloprotease n=1 Tax=Jannaschia donghaensis TaxID=420998 RepID=A0A0M6YK78_9RHOB|nr:site-2 protease family protein [Jannaschia donghaensis]CTQ50350.1 Putative zinc metalloproteasec/MT2700 [Jannaschia donghaensis]
MWGRSWQIGRLAGIDLQVDASWFFIAALLTWSLAVGVFPDLLPGTGPVALILTAIAAMLGLFASLILHELSHALVARAYGLRVRSITLFVFGGVAELQAEPPTPAVEARVALAGPLASLAIAAIAFVASLLPAPVGTGAVISAILGYLAVANIVLAVFNMLPAFPLDGGRVLRSYFWGRSGDLSRATRQAVGVGKWIAIAMIALAVAQFLGGAGPIAFWPILIALFILAAGQSARARTDVVDVLSALSVAQVMRRDPVVTHPKTSLQDVADRAMLRHGLSYVPVVENERPVGEIDLATMRAIDRDLWSSTRVNDVFHPFEDTDLIGPEAGALPLFERMIREGRRKFPVVRGGRLIGVVTLSDLLARVRTARDLAPQDG